MQSEFALYGAPGGEDLLLSMRPRLESWDAKTMPSQVALLRYLDYVTELVRDRLGEIGDVPLAVELAVALAPGLSLTTGGYDLDNYLYPLARLLGHRRIASARASKATGTTSSIRIGPAAAADPPELEGGWSFVTAETTVSTATSAWKRQIAEQIADATPASDGPLEVQLALAVASRRNWAWLWKPAIDSLGTILGIENPRKPFSTRDDRIVRLALHRTIDDALGNRVRVGVWWRPSMGGVSPASDPRRGTPT